MNLLGSEEGEAGEQKLSDFDKIIMHDFFCPNWILIFFCKFLHINEFKLPDRVLTFSTYYVLLVKMIDVRKEQICYIKIMEA